MFCKLKLYLYVYIISLISKLPLFSVLINKEQSNWTKVVWTSSATSEERSFSRQWHHQQFIYELKFLFSFFFFFSAFWLRRVLPKYLVWYVKFDALLKRKDMGNAKKIILDKVDYSHTSLAMHFVWSNWCKLAKRSSL